MSRHSATATAPDVFKLPLVPAPQLRPALMPSSNPTGRPNDPTAVPSLSASAVALMCSLLAAGAIHVAVIHEHMEEWPAAGIFFLALALVQGALAVAVGAQLGRAARWPIALVSTGTLALWVVSRLWGLPVGPEAGMPEPLGIADSISGGFELASLLLVMLAPNLASTKSGVQRTARWVTTSAAVAVAACALTVVALQGATAGHAGGDEAGAGQEASQDS